MPAMVVYVCGRHVADSQGPRTAFIGPFLGSTSAPVRTPSFQFSPHSHAKKATVRCQ